MTRFVGGGAASKRRIGTKRYVRRWWRDTERLAAYLRLVFRVNHIDWELIAINVFAIAAPEVVRYVASLPMSIPLDSNETASEYTPLSQSLGLM